MRFFLKTEFAMGHEHGASILPIHHDTFKAESWAEAREHVRMLLDARGTVTFRSCGHGVPDVFIAIDGEEIGELGPCDARTISVV